MLSMEPPDEWNSGENVDRSVRKDSYSPTIRLTLNLKDPDEENCSVFDYKVLVAEEKRKRRREKEKRQANGVLEENQEDDKEVKRLAQHFNDKYGGSNSTKKKKKKKAPTFYNYSELGWGYDENDSFIDNSEFDEALPDEMETFHGGYYVNVGTLEFKEVEIPEENSEDEIRVGKRKNGILKSDDSGSDGEMAKSDDEESKTDTLVESTSRKLPEVCELMNVDYEPVIKQNITPTIMKISVPKEREQTLANEVKLNGESAKKKKYKKRHISDVERTEGFPKSKKKSVTVKIMLEEKRVVEISKPSDEVEKEGHQGDLNSNTNTTEAVTTLPVTNNGSAEKTEQTKLPDNLSSDVHQLIMQIRNTAQNSESGARALFKSPPLNSKLLRLEAQVKSLKSAGRHAVYEYLAKYFRCSKDTLMKRAKKLLIEEEEKHTIEPFKKLKACIDRLMPSYMENYTSMCQQVADEKNVGEMKNGNVDEKENILSKMPQKKFIWTEECRAHLQELVTCRLKCFNVIKHRKETADEYVKKYLDSKVKPLWPSGWIDTPELMKEAQLSSLPLKIKKNSSSTNVSAASSSQTVTNAAAASNSTKKSNVSVPSSSGVSTTSSMNDFTFIQNTLALQSLAMQYPSQSNVSCTTTAASSIPYHPDLRLLTDTLSSHHQSLTMSVLSRMALPDTLSNQTKSSSPPKVATSPSPSPVSSSLSTSSSYPNQRSTAPVVSSNSTENKKSTDTIKSNESFKIDSLINSSKSTREHFALNHVSQYNKNYSHKTEKRKRSQVVNNLPSENETQGSHAKSSPKFVSKEFSKKTAKDQEVLDLSPVKSKSDTDNQLQVDNQTLKIESNVSITNPTSAEVNPWNCSVKVEDCQLKKVYSQSPVPPPPPKETRVSPVPASKPTHFNRKQRLLQESVKNAAPILPISELTNSKQSTLETGANLVPEKSVSQKFFINMSKDRDPYSISKLLGEVDHRKTLTTVKSTGETCKREEPTSCGNLISKLVEDTFRRSPSINSPVAITKFERGRLEQETRTDERVMLSPDLIDSKIRPSSRDSSHSSSSSLNLERRTPNSERVESDATDLLKDLQTLNDRFPRRMEFDSKKASASTLNDLNYGNPPLLINHSSLSANDEKKTNLPKVVVTPYQSEFYKHVHSSRPLKNDSSYNSNGTNDFISRDNCFISEPSSLETERSYPYQQSVIMPPASTRWYSPESKS